MGSLPRPADLHALSVKRRKGEAVDPSVYGARVRQAVADIVRKQADAGIDIISDGEMSKPSFITYMNERLSGFAPDSIARNRG